VLKLEAGIVTGVKNVSDNEVTLYPTPTTDKLIISSSGLQPQKHVDIYSVNGTKVCSVAAETSITELDMSRYEPGIYFVKISFADNVVLTKKIIKR
jgi:hypothetical protein